jgi:lambda repressor-like predicted transcriptional regulator
MTIIMVNPIRRANQMDKKMSIHDLHPEDIKASIRKKFTTVRNFERVNKLPINGVADILRGRTSARVEKAIESVLMDASDTGKQRPKQPQKFVNHKKVAA